MYMTMMMDRLVSALLLLTVASAAWYCFQSRPSVCVCVCRVQALISDSDLDLLAFLSDCIRFLKALT